MSKLGLKFQGRGRRNVAMLVQKYRKNFCLSRFRQPEVGIVDAPEKAIDIPMAPKKDGRTAPGKLLIHEFRNCVHQINMELDLAERGLAEKFNYADLVSAVDFMTRSLEELRVRLVRQEGDRTDKTLELTTILPSPRFELQASPYRIKKAK